MRSLLALPVLLLPTLVLAEETAEATPSPFSRRAVITATAELLSGPAEGAAARGTVAEGTVVAAAPEPVHGHRRVRLTTGETGYVSDAAVRLEDGEPPPVVAPGPTSAENLAPASLAPPAPRPTARTTFSVRLGLAMPRHDDISAYDNGIALAGVFAGRAGESLGYDVMFGFYRNTFSSSGYSSSILTIPVLGAVRLGGNVGTAYAYGLVGAGVGIFEWSGESNSATATPFLVQVGAGLKLPMTAKMGAELEFRYVVGTASLSQIPVGIDTLLVLAGLSFE